MTRTVIARALITTLVATSAGYSFMQSSDIKPGHGTDGASLVTTEQVLTPLGDVRTLPGERPKDVATSPDGRTVAVLTTRGLHLYTSAGERLATVNRAAGPLGVAWAPDDASVYFSGASDVVRVAFTHGVVGALTPIELEPPTAKPKGLPASPQPAGIAVSPNGDRIYVALGTRNSVAVIDSATRAVVRTLPVGVCPYNVLLSADGRTLYAANRGGRQVAGRRRDTAISAGTQVRVERRTDAALRGSVTAVDTDTWATREADVGRQPGGMALSTDGSRLYVANSDDDTVSVLDTMSLRTVARIRVNLPRETAFGAMPTDLCITNNGELLATCGGTNAAALISTPSATSVRAFVPTAWFPIAAARTDHGTVVACAKGFGSRNARPAGNYGAHDSLGVLQFISDDQVTNHPGGTAAAVANSRAGADAPPRHGVRPLPVPERVGEPSVFRHVVYIIKENHTYDLDLGDMPEGNGDRRLTIFGEQVTPNEHALAREFVLLDNTYTSGTNSADGHQWTSSAICNAYQEQNYSANTRSYPYDGGDPLAYSPQGFLWTAAERKGLDVRVYGEFVNRPQIIDTQAAKGTKARPTWQQLWEDYRSGGSRFTILAQTDNAALRKHLHPNFIGFPQIVSDQWRADQYLADLRRFERTGKMPALSILLLPNNHTSGTSPGMPTPRAAVADNDLALGRIVEGISHSRFWPQTLILVIEDDSQLGVDHVDGHRTLAFCVSPYTVRGVTISRFYTHVSLIRTMGLVLGIPALTRFDRAATPMTACFTETPDLRPYVHRPNRTPLDELNPKASALTGEARRLAAASSKQDWSDVDRAGAEVTARAAWLSLRPTTPFPVHAFRPPDDQEEMAEHAPGGRTRSSR